MPPPCVRVLCSVRVSRTLKRLRQLGGGGTLVRSGRVADARRTVGKLARFRVRVVVVGRALCLCLAAARRSPVLFTRLSCFQPARWQCLQCLLIPCAAHLLLAMNCNECSLWPIDLPASERGSARTSDLMSYARDIIANFSELACAPPMTMYPVFSDPSHHLFPFFPLLYFISHICT